MGAWFSKLVDTISCFQNTVDAGEVRGDQIKKD